MCVVSAMTTFGSAWDVVANPTKKEEEFIAALNFVIAAIVRVAFELPLYKLYDNKFSRDFKAAYKVCIATIWSRYGKYNIVKLDISSAVMQLII